MPGRDGRRAKIESGRLEIRHREFDPKATVRGAVELFSERARGKGLSLACELAPEMPNRLLGDPDRLAQIVHNLVSNAIKFTEQGAVEVRLGAPADRDGTRLLRLEVVDTGSGIDPEDQERTFDEFTQAGDYATRRHGGGWALSISRKLAEALGGTLTVVSSQGRGARFTLLVPLEEAPGAEPAPAVRAGTASRVSGLRVLLAEDNEVNRDLAVEILELLGCRVDAARNGREAVAAFVGAPYDVVLMDCQMPEMDGFEATRLIRQREAANGGLTRVPIMALTGHALSGERERCLAAGMDGFLSKPFRIDQLRALLETAVPQGEALRPGEAGPGL